MNIGKWVLRNIFIGFIREEQRARRTRNVISNTNEPQALQKVSASYESAGTLSRNQSWTDVSSMMQNVRSPVLISTSSYHVVGSTVIASPKMIPAIAPSPTGSTAPTARSSPLIAPLIPLHMISKDPAALPMPVIPQSPEQNESLPTPMPRPHARSPTEGPGAGSPSAFSTLKDGDYFSMRTRQASMGVNTHANAVSTPEDLAAWSGGKALDPSVPQTPLTPGAGLMGRLKNFGKVGGAGVKKGAAGGFSNEMPTSPVVGASFPEVLTDSCFQLLYKAHLLFRTAQSIMVLALKPPNKFCFPEHLLPLLPMKPPRSLYHPPPCLSLLRRHIPVGIAYIVALLPVHGLT